jgi:NADP-dependent 3-hydroxy acid dehydrogenase YdfG
MSTPRLTGKVVAITGASAGIGRACAEALWKEGAHVVLSARRADRLHALVEEASQRGARALAVPGDVTNEDDMRTLVSRSVETFGRLDVMICNAGIGFHGPLDDTPPQVMRRLVDVNIMGTFYAAHAAMKVFRRQSDGHIIAISSMAGRRGVSGSSIYAATKAAQIAFIEALRAEFYGSKLHASVVYPVVTSTEFHETITRDFGHVIGGQGPRQTAEEVADAIVDCIVSPKAEVYPFPKAWWLSVLSVVAPAHADRVVQKFGRHRQPVPASTDDPAGS